MRKQTLGDYIEKVSISCDDLGNKSEIKILGVSNIEGVTETSHRRSVDISNYLVVRKNDFAYNPYRINVGSIGLMEKNIIGAVSPAYIVFRLKENTVIPELLLEFLKSKSGLFQISKYARGTVRKALRYEDLCKIEINFPTYKRQLEILNHTQKIVQIRSKIVSESQKQKELILRIKQSVLQDLVNKKHISSSSEILDEIRTKRDILIKKKEIKKLQNFLKIRDHEKPQKLLGLNTAWVRMSDVCHIEKGNTGIKNAIPGGYPLVVTGETRLSHNDYQFDCKAVIVPLVSSTGHGHASLKRIHYQEGKFAVGTILACIHPIFENLINMKYLFNYLDIYKEDFFVSKMTGAANVTLKISTLYETPIPLISKNEQDKYEEVMNHLDEILKEIGLNEKKLETYMESLFRELVGN